MTQMIERLSVPMIAEGRIYTPKQTKQAFEIGAWCVGQRLQDFEPSPRDLLMQFKKTASVLDVGRGMPLPYKIYL